MLEVRTEYKNINDLFDLYIELGWNRINLSKEELNIMTKNSWYNLFYYDDKRLIWTGRIISDGIITGIICGVGVSPKYQKQGIGKNIVKELVSFCESKKVFPQLLCEKDLVGFYKSLDFEEFAIGMNYKIKSR